MNLLIPTPKPLAADLGQKTFSITSYGALADGETLNTAAIQEAIDLAATCSGQVLVPEGIFLCGKLTMRSNVSFHLVKGAVLKGSSKLTDYGKDRWHDAFIVGENLNGFSFSGEGIIDGSDCKNFNGEEGFRGPHGILLHKCTDFLFTGITLTRIGNYAIYCNDCSHFALDQVTILRGHDGLHINRCHQVKVTGCNFRTGDDAYAGCDNRDVTVTDSSINTACNGFRLGCDGLTVRQCHFWGPACYPHQISSRLNMGPAFVHFAPGDRQTKMASDRWLIEDCTFDMIDSLYEIRHPEGLWQDAQPAREVVFRNIRASGLKDPIHIEDQSGVFVLAIENATLSLRAGCESGPLLIGKSFRLLEIRNLSLKNDGTVPVIQTEGGGDVSLKGIQPDPGDNPEFFDLKHTGTTKISSS